MFCCESKNLCIVQERLLLFTELGSQLLLHGGFRHLTIKEQLSILSEEWMPSTDYLAGHGQKVTLMSMGVVQKWI